MNLVRKKKFALIPKGAFTGPHVQPRPSLMDWEFCFSNMRPFWLECPELIAYWFEINLNGLTIARKALIEGKITVPAGFKIWLLPMAALHSNPKIFARSKNKDSIIVLLCPLIVYLLYRLERNAFCCWLLSIEGIQKFSHPFMSYFEEQKPDPCST